MKEEFSEPFEYKNKLIKEYVGLTIKEAYEQNPKINYPMITIQEIDNSEAEQYSSNIGEEFSDVAYQINIYTRDISSMQKNEIIRKLADKVNNVLGVKLGMIRDGSIPPVPVPSDSTILQYSVRYTGVLDIIRDIIYKK